MREKYLLTAYEYLYTVIAHLALVTTHVFGLF